MNTLRSLRYETWIFIIDFTKPVYVPNVSYLPLALYVTIRSGKNWSPTLLLYNTDRVEHDMYNNSSMFVCVFVAAVKCLPSRCLATLDGIHIETHRLMGGIYEVRRWGAMIYIPSFVKCCSGIQKMIWGDSQIHRQQGDLISLLWFFKIRKLG
jgi:hypothetical protein